MDDKVIVTNRKALIAKYGPGGLLRIERALDALVQADEKRDIQCRIVHVDNARTMRAFGSRAVTVSHDPKQNKRAVDAIFKALDPAYLLIVGASDIVPHQPLRNTVYGRKETNDDDASVWSDLPYACDTPYSLDPKTFVGPTRVVGRLPDLTKAKSPIHLLALLRTAARYKPKSPSEYSSSHFALSAYSWRESTRLTMQSVFQDASQLLLAPPQQVTRRTKTLGNLMHLINCHGGQGSPEFVGQKGSSFKTSLSSSVTAGRISRGTVAAVECCYGAELYAPSSPRDDLPICQSYMRQGAYGYFGSTTIAYGPAKGNGGADLICQYFLAAVLLGASLGRAALIARQKFVEQAKEMDTVDFKTLSQFYLLGDPSLHPVRLPRAVAAIQDVDDVQAERYGRAARRAQLKARGVFLEKTKPTATRPAPPARLSPSVKNALTDIALLAKLPEEHPFSAMAVDVPRAAMSRSSKKESAPSRYHLAFGVPAGASARQSVAVVAKEQAGKIVGFRIYQRR